MPHLQSTYLKIVGKVLRLKTIVLLCPVHFSVDSKEFEKLVNNKDVDNLEKCGLFFDFQYGFSALPDQLHFFRELYQK